jgi:hypothetical protein
VRTGAGSSYVMVKQADGTQKQVDVVVGLKGSTTTEISGAIKAGDVVVLPASTVARSSTTTNTNNRNGTGAFGGPAGGFGGGPVAIGGGRG